MFVVVSLILIVLPCMVAAGVTPTEVIVRFGAPPPSVIDRLWPAIVKEQLPPPTVGSAVKFTEPLPKLVVAETPVIHSQKLALADQVHELTGTPGSGIAVTLAVPVPPFSPKEVVVELTVYVHRGFAKSPILKVKGFAQFSKKNGGPSPT
jgi:hypothetical protein